MRAVELNASRIVLRSGAHFRCEVTIGGVVSLSCAELYVIDLACLDRW